MGVELLPGFMTPWGSSPKNARNGQSKKNCEAPLSHAGIKMDSRPIASANLKSVEEPPSISAVVDKEVWNLYIRTGLALGVVKP